MAYVSGLVQGIFHINSKHKYFWGLPSMDKHKFKFYTLSSATNTLEIMSLNGHREQQSYRTKAGLFGP